MAERRPNILWFIPDQQRADTIGALGNPAINTPNLDKLVSRGVAFRRNYIQNQVCTPSRASFLTGRYPATTQVYRNGIPNFPKHEVIVTRLLAEHGYDGCLCGKLHLSAAKYAEERHDDGYRVYNWAHISLPTIEQMSSNQYLIWLKETKGIDPFALFADYDRAVAFPGVPSDLHHVTWCTDRALEFLEDGRDKNKPWLLSVNIFDPHNPYDPPPEYWDRYDPAAMPQALFREEELESQKRFAAVRQPNPLPIDPRGPMPDLKALNIPGNVRGIVSTAPPTFNAQVAKAGYYGMIEHVDHHLGRLMDAVEAMGELDNTIIVYMSDHGEMLGDHGCLWKSARAYDGLVKVPLILSWPARWLKDRRSDALTELVDVAPTLLEAASAPAYPDMQGRSLHRLLSGEAPLDAHKDIVVTDFYDSLGRGDPDDWTRSTMTFDGETMLVVYHNEGLGELFDHTSDPDEFVNLWDDPGARDLKQERLLSHLRAVTATTSSGPGRVSMS